jgi:poly-gamma-glutamate synthesis protein (capsule biosynthesis protein)
MLEAMPHSNPEKGEASEGTDVITLFLCGDVMTGRGIDQVLPHPGSPRICERYTTSADDYVKLAERLNGAISKPVNFDYIWGDALEELERTAPDLRIINLETSVTRSEDCTDKGISYRMSPENAPCITAANIDCTVLANNHVLDWGRAGLVETLETLKRSDVKTVGAGHDIASAAAPAILEVPNKGRVIVWAFGSVTSGIPQDWAAAVDRPGVNLLADLSNKNVMRIAGQVREAKEPGDIVVASIHWGSNWGYQVPSQQREFAHALIDEAGVDVVHGHSSHHARAIEVYKKKPIFYGCGDFLNDYEGITGYEEFRDDLVLMYFLRIAPLTGELVHCDMRALQIRNFRLNHASKEDARWLRDVLNRESKKFGTGVEQVKDNALVLKWR